MSAKLKKGDGVYVLSGKWRGEEGTLVTMIPKDRAVIEIPSLSPQKQEEKGRRTVKKSQANPKGGLVERAISVHVSNLALNKKNEKK